MMWLPLPLVWRDGLMAIGGRGATVSPLDMLAVRAEGDGACCAITQIVPADAVCLRHIAVREAYRTNDLVMGGAHLTTRFGWLSTDPTPLTQLRPPHVERTLSVCQVSPPPHIGENRTVLLLN